MNIQEVQQAIKKYDNTPNERYGNPLMSKYYESFLEEDMLPPCSYREVESYMLRNPNEVEKVMKKNNFTL